ncbi:MAG: DEAD/DEAH box helicase [Clostridiales bacterium]|nr:DEAD/DEAH box helicase [Clostridiales bacterium]
MPKSVAHKFGIMPLGDALGGVHFPKNREQLAACRRSVSIENLCYVITTYRLLKDDKRDFTYNAALEIVDKFVKSLPFSLTDDQKNAIDGIITAMRSEKLVNMLVQGEVGSGKTVVALCAMYYAAMSGYQAAIMAPTEILARQHYATMTKFLEPLGVQSQLLCASMNKVQKETALFNIKYGVASCIVGTQSLIGDDIDYNDLRLVIVDEQQRFGVNQRAKLEQKGKKTDIIVTTATPIPRTLALSLYGELKVCEIHALPAGRPKVHTSVVPQRKINDMFRYVGECAAKDERTYVICPRIADTDDEVTGVEQVYNMLKKSSLAPITGCVHGKMKEAEKTAVMDDFKSGKIKVLVSTTVIEVGIDVPEATNVIVYDAERFGLAQLHQIRGRVGRGTKESYCFLLGGESSPEAFDRLKKFCSVTDGFSVSELDFKLRGAGDFVGLRQHGAGTLEIDEGIIERARKLSDAVIDDGSSSDAIIRSMSNPEFIRSVTMN